VRDLPSGTVTFLFTDVEGSTRLLHELRDAYADELNEHRRIARAVFSRHGGVEVDTQGDAFFVAFRRASDALSAARDLTQALDGPIRVRVGVHTGEPLVTEEGYVGIDVHRAARIAAAGHGGQVLVSQSTRDLAATDDLRDLGRHRLKDLTAPERIYQLGEANFPPLKTLDRVSLPIAATPLIGRQNEVAELTAMVRGGRLVTVTGAGGSGKTRLALQVAAELADDFADGVFFVGLAPVQDPGLVAPTMAQTAGVRALADLNELALLLVLDNFEHLLPAASTLSELLAHAPHVKLLTTSRTRLHVAAEVEYPLEPFPDNEAVAFFIERARAVRRDVRDDDAVREICRRLDGLPLALELAASRVKVLDPPQLLERLARRLPVLTGGSRDAPERQQTLRATIEWSFTLLDTKLQVLFRQLAVFAGSFSLETAEQVATAEIDDLAALVDWSLLKPIGNGRFLMLETIREYAHELFEQSAESEAIARAHLDVFLELAEEAERQLVGPDQLDWYERLTVDQDNLRAALELACSMGDGERAQRLAGSLWRFWWNRGQLDEGERWYERAFAAGDAVPSPSRARALLGASHMTEARGDSERTRAFLEEAVDTFRSTDDAWRLAIALTHLAGTQPAHGEALRLNEEAIDVAEAAGDARNVSLLKHNLGYLTEEGGNDEQAEALYEESLAGTRAIGDVYGTSATLGDLARLALRRGDRDEAAANLRESLELSRALGDTHSLAHTLTAAAATVLALSFARDAARICGAQDVLCKQHGFKLEPLERALLAETIEATRRALGGEFEGSWAAGTQLELGNAVELALHRLEPVEPRSS
jgi:predicted ATPase/class 3 adenylate cyclase/Tfp pilus assembly protein PilF